MEKLKLGPRAQPSPSVSVPALVSPAPVEEVVAAVVLLLVVVLVVAPVPVPLVPALPPPRVREPLSVGAPQLPARVPQLRFRP